jgi:hypothetical protein
MADEIEIPAALRAAVARDLRPVRPLARPLARLVWVVPVAIAVVAATVAVFGVRRDAPQLGMALTWIASGLQLVLGLALVAAALRESVPGTTLSRRAIGLVLGTGIIVTVTVTFMTWMVSPTRIAPEFVRYVWSVCVAGTIAAALPVLAVSGWLAARAFPLRPRIAGALYGLGAGLVADAGWRLFCHFSDPVHVLGAHTLAVAIVVAVAALTAQPPRRTLKI